MSERMKANERLAWAIENHGPGDRTARAFQRVLRKRLTSKIVGSFYAITGYLEGTRQIPPSFFVAAAAVLRPVSAEWMETGEGPRLLEAGQDPDAVLRSQAGEDVGSHDEVPTTRAEALAAQEPASSAPPTADDPYADIRPVVVKAGPTPPADGLEILDPSYPRRGQSQRNWGILHAVVTGTPEAQVAEDVDLSEARVKAICEEYAELVRNVSGINT